MFPSPLSPLSCPLGKQETILLPLWEPLDLPGRLGAQG